MTKKIFHWLDANSQTFSGRILNQAMPVITCVLLFAGFIGASYLFIDFLINPFSKEAVVFELQLQDVIVGFLLYFLTAVDYALIVGRMQTVNPGAKARFVMNVFTCLGCFFGVTIVLFLWGFAKEIPWLIIPILIFAGSVMVKLAYEGKDYFEKSRKIPAIIRKFTARVLHILHTPTQIMTEWMPELGRPKAERMRLSHLAQWSFFLPFIIGLDDLIGYMGAMTVYNAFGLLFGIYLADIIIDLMIFIFPRFTTRLVENPLLSLFGAYAFLYLAYKSYSESIILLLENYHAIGLALLVTLLLVSLFFVRVRNKKTAL